MGMIEERNDFIEAHYRKHYDRLVRSLGHRVGYHNAADAVQEAYTRALEHWKTYDKERPFDAWFTPVIEQSCHWVLRSHVQDTAEEANTETSLRLAEHPVAEATYQLSLIQDMLEFERPDHRMAIMMHMILGFSSEETGRATYLEADNVRQIVQRFRERLA